MEGAAALFIAETSGCVTQYTRVNAINICNEIDGLDGINNNSGGDITMATNANADTGTRAVNAIIPTASGTNEVIEIILNGVIDTEDVTISIRVANLQGSNARLRLPTSKGWVATQTSSNFSGSSYTTYNITGIATKDAPGMEIQFLSGHANNDEIDFDSLDWVVN